MAPEIRWMVRSDMPSVFAIERECFPFPWREQDFINVLRQRNCIGMVAEQDETVVGYFIFELFRHKLSILNFAVHPDYHFQGIGTALVDKLKSKLNPERRSRIVLNIHESNLGAHLFFQKQGFEATGIVQDAWDIPGDAYAFCFRVNQCVGV